MRALGLVLIGALAAAGCTSGRVGDSANNRDPNSPGGPGRPGPGAGSGGAAGPGGAQPPSGGSNPSTPAPPNTVSDAGMGAPGAGADGGAAEPACQVSIQAVNPPRLFDLLAGPTAKLRVRAQVTGTMVPASPSWDWEVLAAPVGIVEVTPVTPSADTVDIPLRNASAYLIRATVVGGCRGEITATAVPPEQRMTTYWARITPPRTTGLPTQEATLELGGGQPATKVISLVRGVAVTIEPRNDQGQAIRSYIRVSSPRSSVRFEGNNLSQGFKVELHPTHPYDVLIVPEGSDPPALIGNKVASTLHPNLFMLSAGFAITGSVQAPGTAGALAPVAGARVFLRAGILPSSIGETTAGGTFELRTREGAFQVSVVPKADSGLPEARLPAGQSYTPSSQPGPVQLTYGTFQTAAVQIQVRSSDGQQAIVGARVRLEAESDSLGTVGTFRLPPDDREVAAVGALRAEATTDDTGAARFMRLPVGRYRAVIAPPASAIGMATTVATVEVTAGMAPARISLVSPVRLTGRLLPASLSMGLKLLAIESDGPNPGEALSATVDASGQFSLSVAPGRGYRLQIEPAQERKLPRLFLGPHTAGTADASYGDVNLFEGVPVTGMLTSNAVAVPDAVVQIFCTGGPPDCVDPNAPQVEAARPLAETKAGPDGRFQVFLPDPARWDL